MQSNALVLLSLSVPLSIPVFAPFVASIERFRYFGVERNIVQRYAVISTFVILIAAAYFIGLRFQSAAANIVLQFIALGCYLNLAGFVFTIKPRSLGLILGLAVLVLSLLIALGSILSFAIDGKTNQIKLTSTFYCEVNQFGFAGSQGGLNVSIYRYLGFGISRRLLHDTYLDEIKYPFQNQEGACSYAMAKVNG
jgi:hypothetical protein